MARFAHPRTAWTLLSSAAAVALITLPASAEPGAGTIDDPVVVDAMPYAIADTTAMAPSQVIDSYDCSANTDETGPERVYRFSLSEPARVMAWVEGDGNGVDIDVHLLDDLELVGASANACAARNDVIAEAEMMAGEHYVVVDTFNGGAQAGPFVLRLDAIGDSWIERPVAEGVSRRARRFADLNGSQVVHELIVDTTMPNVEIRAIASTGCQTVATLGQANVAVAGINGGYFSLNGGCAPVSLLIESGALVGTNAVSRGAFGLTDTQTPIIDVVAQGQDWPAAHEAHGGGPVLVVGGVANNGPAAWSAEGFNSSNFNGPNPRTFAGIDSSGRSHLLTVDGRRSNAAGMSLDDLAAFAAGSELGMVDAVNLDGGGSTTMWVDGATPNGVLNYPSDATQEDSTHPGSRANSGGLFVFAPPHNHAPRFQTQPVTAAQAGQSYVYDVDAIDLDVLDVVSYAIADGPADMTIDEATGVVSFEPTATSPPSTTVILSASDDRGATSEQQYSLTIEGGMGTGAGGGGGAGGQGGGAGAALDADLGPEDDGCGCRLVAPVGDDTAATWLLLSGMLLAWVRRRT